MRRRDILTVHTGGRELHDLGPLQLPEQQRPSWSPRRQRGLFPKTQLDGHGVSAHKSK